MKKFMLALEVRDGEIIIKIFNKSPKKLNQDVVKKSSWDEDGTYLFHIKTHNLFFMSAIVFEIIRRSLGN